MTSTPEYPAQVPNVSYGFGQLTTNRTLIGSNASVRVRVPGSGIDGTNWTTIGFNDSAWTVGTNGVGYGTTNVAQADYGVAIAPTAPLGHWRFSEISGATAANAGSGGAGLNGDWRSASTAPSVAYFMDGLSGPPSTLDRPLLTSSALRGSSCSAHVPRSPHREPRAAPAPASSRSCLPRESED